MLSSGRTVRWAGFSPATVDPIEHRLRYYGSYYDQFPSGFAGIYHAFFDRWPVLVVFGRSACFLAPAD